MIRIAIVGAGAIADTHIQSYRKFGDRCEVVAVADLYPEKAAEKVARHGLAARVFAAHDELLAGAAFDAVSICLPPFAHADAAVALLRAGRHVLVEKPMAGSVEECDRMLAAAADGGALLSVVAQNRFKTPVMRLKSLLDAGAIGRVLHGQADSFWWRGSNYYDLWWRGTWDKEGGGCTMNHAVHQIDQFHWLMGMPDEVRALTLNLAHENSEVEDFSTAVLRYDDGRVGQITASLVHHGEEQQLAFQGERAKLGVPWQVKAMRQRENGFPETDEALVADLTRRYHALPEVVHDGHDGQVADFLDAIEGRAPLLVDGVAGRRTIELVTAIYQSSHTGQAVRLPLKASDPFYTREGILANATRFHRKTRSVENFADNAITLGRDLGK